MVEIVIAVGIAAAAGFIFYRNVRKRAKGQCECGSCSKACPLYEKEHMDKK
jgi:hypothetical protein